VDEIEACREAHARNMIPVSPIGIVTNTSMELRCRAYPPLRSMTDGGGADEWWAKSRNVFHRFSML